MDTIKQRIHALRSYMGRNNLSAFIIPSTDPHAGEYIPDHWKTREWFSGFTGSAGTLVVTTDQAALWTDSRYFLQAEEQLRDTTIQLMKERLPETPSISEWLTSILSPQDIVGIEGWVNTIAETEALYTELQKYGIQLQANYDPATEIWTNRPSIPLNPICIQPIEYAGISCHKKIEDIRKALTKTGAAGILLSALDEIAWTLNLRGNDVHCNPVFVSYLLITHQDAILFINPKKLTQEIIQYLDTEDVSTEDYNAIQETLQAYPYATLYLDDARTNYAILESLPLSAKIIRGMSPVASLKAIKNQTEIEGFHQAMLRDGIAMVKFLKWLEEAVPKGKETEISIDQKLYQFRSQQALFKGISFDTIAGYQENGAIVHYEATPETNKALKAEGLLLLDCGAQYQDGTTDITRTIALGNISETARKDYTLVLKGHIQLSRACFPQGTCGTQLDVLARAAMWKEGINFMHGTGHGVGSYLNVHEGPHQIRMNYVPTPLCPGMTVTDEPGIYRAGSHGVRIENTLLVIPYKKTDFGTFYTFEPLTLCPIDTTPILTELLTIEEKEWLNDYHHTVYEKLAPHLDEEHRNWLKEKTHPIK